MEWPSPWGVGFPGWHIECSAMAQKYLGDYFDIHCGGEDHIPVHHTNEIAQTEARVGTRLANFWMHGYFLLSNDAKMAKSAGEFLRLKVLTDRGYDPLAYRYLCLTAHYRTQMNFTWDALDAATTALDRLRNGVHGLGAPGEPDAGYLERFGAELNADLNTPRAHGDRVGSAARRIACGGEEGDAARVRSRIWAGARDMAAARQRRFRDAVQELAAARAAARAAKQWAEADRLRAGAARDRVGNGRRRRRLRAQAAVDWRHSS